MNHIDNKKIYHLIALDMDGTLLNSEKKITEATKVMIRKAIAAGKEVVLSTGRCIAELESTFRDIPELHYAICISGSMVYDIQKRRPILTYPLSPEICNEILKRGRKEESMVHFLSEKSVVQKDYINRMDQFGMGVYIPMFSEVTDPVDDIYDYYKRNQMPLGKLNLYHHSVEARERTKERLKDLPIEIAYAEETSLECSAKGVTKGRGLKDLCQYLEIPLEETIAVGDADNDLDVLRTAGLSVAMGNANENVKAICDVQVADCDHDGCAEAIKTYLL